MMYNRFIAFLEQIPLERISLCKLAYLKGLQTHQKLPFPRKTLSRRFSVYLSFLHLLYLKTHQSQPLLQRRILKV